MGPQKRKYDPNEIVVVEHGCRDVESLESPYTMTAADAGPLLKDRAQIRILSKTRDETRKDVGEKEEELDFELTGVSPAAANLFRRTILMEIPTMAIDLAVFYDNDGVIFDEALAHRLGLVPLDVDADLFDYCSSDINTTNPDPKCVLKFALNVTADRDNFQVYSSDLIYIPLEGAPILETPPAPVHKKILLTKLAKGQSIKCLCFAIKGVGKQHAKWSPAACVSYKPQPIVRVQGKVSGKAAERLVKVCPGKVFDIEDGFLEPNRPLQCTMCRECIRTDTEEEVHVELGLKKYSFDFHVESVGVYPVTALFSKAARLYASHCRRMIHEVENSWPSTMVENNDPSKEDYL